MKKTISKNVRIICCIIAMILIIFDSGSAINGAKEGIKLCLCTVIPSLFPYCVLSIWFRSLISGYDLRWLRPIERFCAMPEGTGNILLLGLLGGYPIGAICVENAVKEKQLTQTDAKYLRAICNNAGPSFIIGIIGCVLKNKTRTFMLIFIQALSAIITNIILSDHCATYVKRSKHKAIDLAETLTQASRCMVSVSSIIVLFRTFLSVLYKYSYQMIPNKIWALMVGFIELTNGILLLPDLIQEEIMFIAAAGMISFGGLCTIMQTLAISSPGSGRSYVFAKSIQAFVSIILAYLYLHLHNILLFFITYCLSWFFIILLKKKRTRRLNNILKNSRNSVKNTV